MVGGRSRVGDRHRRKRIRLHSATMSLLIGPIGGELAGRHRRCSEGIYLCCGRHDSGRALHRRIGGSLRGPPDDSGVFSLRSRADLLASDILTDIRWFYCAMLLAALASGTTALTFSALIARWFDRRRGPQRLAWALGLGL
jgi:hypothetical protein